MKKKWTPEEDKLLLEMFADSFTEEVAARLGRTYSSVAYRANALGLTKSIEVKAKTRFQPGHSDPAGRFKPGHRPWNAGLKFYAGGRAVETRFKKGHLPKQTLYDGAITIRSDKSGKPYKYIRKSLRKWEALHRVIWEEHYGPIPKGMIVVFKNRDTMDIRPENLELISRKENMIRNSIARYPQELKMAIRALHKLKRKIDEKQNH
jgi:hypothetical protein